MQAVACGYKLKGRKMKEGKELFLKHLKECGVNLERIKWYKQAAGYNCIVDLKMLN